MIDINIIAQNEKKTFFILNTFFVNKNVIILANILKKSVKKLVLILTTSILITSP